MPPPPPDLMSCQLAATLASVEQGSSQGFTNDMRPTAPTCGFGAVWFLESRCYTANRRRRRVAAPDGKSHPGRAVSS